MTDFETWRNSAGGRAAAERADSLTKKEKIAKIICIMMQLAGESPEMIAEMREKCMKGGEHNDRY